MPLPSQLPSRPAQLQHLVDALCRPQIRRPSLDLARHELVNPQRVQSPCLVNDCHAQRQWSRPYRRQLRLRLSHAKWTLGIIPRWPMLTRRPSASHRARGVEGLSAVSPHQHVSVESPCAYAAPALKTCRHTLCHVDRNWHRALLADAGFVLHGHHGPAPRLQEISFDDLLQLLTAVLGTKPTSKPVRRMSAIRGKPDVTQTCRDDRL